MTGGLKKEKTERRGDGLDRGLCSVPLSGSSQPCSGNSPSGRLLSGPHFPAPPERNFHDTGRQRKWTSLCAITHSGTGWDAGASRARNETEPIIALKYSGSSLAASRPALSSAHYFICAPRW